MVRLQSTKKRNWRLMQCESKNVFTFPVAFFFLFLFLSVTSVPSDW